MAFLLAWLKRTCRAVGGAVHAPDVRPSCNVRACMRARVRVDVGVLAFAPPTDVGNGVGLRVGIGEGAGMTPAPAPAPEEVSELMKEYMYAFEDDIQSCFVEMKPPVGTYSLELPAACAIWLILMTSLAAALDASQSAVFPPQKSEAPLMRWFRSAAFEEQVLDRS